MSTKLIELNDRIITDNGTVVFGYELLLKQLLAGKSIEGLMTVQNSDVEKYITKMKIPLSFWEDNGDVEGPDISTYDWNIPELYKKLDIEKASMEIMVIKGLINDAYQNRLTSELSIMQERNMYPFVRALVYIIETFRKNDIVWGVGRGSSCASLVLFLLGINKIDPVKYDIPMEEFFK